MFYNMRVRADAPSQTGEGKGQSRGRTSVSQEAADTDESLRNPTQMLLKENIKNHQNVEIHQRFLGESAEISCSIHRIHQFSFFFYYRNLGNVIKPNV